MSQMNPDMNPEMNSATPAVDKLETSKLMEALITLDALEAQITIVGEALLWAQSEIHRLERENMLLRLIETAAREYFIACANGQRQVLEAQKLQSALMMADLERARGVSLKSPLTKGA